MSNVTDYLFEKSNGLIKRVPEYRDEGLGYEAANDGSVECEVGEFLHALVRLQKPRMVLESGTYKGLSSSYIAQGLKENKMGMIDTFEINSEHINTSKQLWTMLDLLPWITSHHMPVQEFKPTCNYDFMFLDSEPDIRFHELVQFFPNLNPGGFVILHDLHHHLGQETIPNQVENWPWGKIPDEIVNWMKTGELKPWYFPNPRGMSGWQKRRAGDFF